jgi:hypothetical protein
MEEKFKPQYLGEKNKRGGRGGEDGRSTTVEMSFAKNQGLPNIRIYLAVIMEVLKMESALSTGKSLGPKTTVSLSSSTN